MNNQQMYNNLCFQMIPITGRKCNHKYCPIDFCNIQYKREQRNRNNNRDNNKNICSCCGIDLRYNKCLWDKMIEKCVICIQCNFRGFIYRKTTGL